MPQQNSQRPAFTLIELLIVVAIIGILAVVAVFSYVGVQRQATVDFAADTVAAALREAQDLARSGRKALPETEEQMSGEAAPLAANSAQCYAVKLVSGPGGDLGPGGLYSAVSDYLAVDGEVVDSCAAVPEDAWRRSDALGTRLVIISAESENIFYFKPPFGRIFGADAGGALRQLTGEIFIFTVGDPDYPAWDRQVTFDSGTGEARKVLPETAGHSF